MESEQKRPIDVIPVRGSHVWEQPLYDEMVLYNLERDLGVSLNASATAVWRLCDGKRTAEEIGRQLAHDMQVSPDEQLVQLIADDVLQTIAELHHFGVIACVPGHASLLETTSGDPLP